MSFDVVVIGSANLDLVVTADRLPGPGETVLGKSYSEHAGGKGLNQAVAACRAGARVAMIGAVGNDDAGTRLRGIAEGEGIDVSRFDTVAGVSTGRAAITVDRHAENSIVVIPGANGRVADTEPPECSIVLAQLEIPLGPVIAAFRRARAAGARTVLNPAPGRELPDGLLALCDIVVPNEHELGLVGGLDALLERGVDAVVVTRGAAGASVTECSADGPITWDRPAARAHPVDTTGAGDAFCGALAARLGEGATLDDAVAFASAAGALATETAGAVPSLPHRSAIEQRREN